MRKLILIFYLSFLASPLFAQNVKVPKLTERVMDLTQTLTSSEKKSLITKLEKLETQKGSQMAVLIIPSTGDESIEQYSIRVVDQWKLGRKDVDDGVLLLLAMNDRKIRIEVGYGLEGVIPDAIAKRIITNVIVPEFRSGHFYQGIDEAVDIMIGAIYGEDLPPVVKKSRTNTRSFNSSKILGFYVFFIVGMMILHTYIKYKKDNKTATIVSFVIILIVGWLLFNFAMGLISSIIGSLILAAKSGGGTGRGGGYYGGGYYGGGYSSGGSFGGFSGGGGGFGGGGASGGW